MANKFIRIPTKLLVLSNFVILSCTLSLSAVDNLNSEQITQDTNQPSTQTQQLNLVIENPPSTTTRQIVRKVVAQQHPVEEQPIEQSVVIGGGVQDLNASFFMQQSQLQNIGDNFIEALKSQREAQSELLKFMQNQAAKHEQILADQSEKYKQMLLDQSENHKKILQDQSEKYKQMLNQLAPKQLPPVATELVSGIEQQVAEPLQEIEQVVEKVAVKGGFWCCGGKSKKPVDTEKKLVQNPADTTSKSGSDESKKPVK